MKLERFNEPIHSQIVLSMTFLGIIYLFLINNPMLYLPIIIFLLMIYHQNQVSLKLIVKIIFGSLIFSIFCSYFILLIPANEFKTDLQLTILNWHFSKRLFQLQTAVFFKVVSISVISLSSIFSLNFEKIMINLMQTKKLNPKLGYPLLLAFNSVGLIKNEYERIKINAKFRGLTSWERVNVFFPLLVFSIRHADRGALSLVTRGLSEQKIYYFDTVISIKDKIIFAVFILGILICIFLNFYLR